MSVNIENLADELINAAVSINAEESEREIINEYIDLINSLLYELNEPNNNNNSRERPSDQIKREIESAMIFLIKKLESFGYSNNQFQTIKRDVINLKFPAITVKPADYEQDFNILCLKGLYSSVQYAVEHDNADPNSFSTGYYALQHACISGSVPTMEYLIEKCDADVDVVDEHGYTLLFLAVLGGYIPIIRYLLKFVHINKNVRDNNGNTPLLFSIKYAPQEKVTLYLLNEGNVDIN